MARTSVSLGTDAPIQGAVIRVRGLVQGVGFRPTVWRLARECGLSGEVCNDAEGVLIQAWSPPAALQQFLDRLRSDSPPLARIDAVEVTALDGTPLQGEFRIAASTEGQVRTGIVADAATCTACMDEVTDSANHRHGYAFTNCTHCGPRLSIVRRIPYDRAHTSMSDFPMCKRCQAEYEDPSDRRFHAQPNACADCGPRLWLEFTDRSEIEPGTDPIGLAQRAIRTGQVVAIKGIGGIHLACNAVDTAAVRQLRTRKRRPDKPLALMARDTDMIRRYCRVSKDAQAALESSAAPIVLLPAEGPEALAPGISPGLAHHGFMLPYTPLHHLLMEGLSAPVVLTSGNRSKEPQCIGNQEAHDGLGDIADAFLLHDRDIVNRLDDSVVRFIGGKAVFLRRARGFAPAPLPLPPGFEESPPVLALGGELKNTFCLLREDQAILSQHLGDLHNARTYAAFQQTLALYLDLFEHRPEVLVIDSHPDYRASCLGRAWAEDGGAVRVEIQHHHAHLASCLADNRVPADTPALLGIALDGTGFGGDGSIWGGEILLADYQGFQRLASILPVPMPGGEQAIRQPWRMAWAHLDQCLDWPELAARYGRLPFFRGLRDKPLDTLTGMLRSGVNSPMTSSCGRLFDAVAAVVGLRQNASYEGQAAIELEACVDPGALGSGYEFEIRNVEGLPRLDPTPMWRQLLRDLQNGADQGVMAARFHAGLATGLAKLVERLSHAQERSWEPRVTLSGGCFQSAVLTECLVRELAARGFETLCHRRVPANDGGLSLGQACIAATLAMRGAAGGGH